MTATSTPNTEAPQGKTLADVFFEAARRHPDRPALDLGGTVWSYDTLARRAMAIAAALLEADDGQELAAFFARRSPDAYAAILGILAAGKGVTPLNPRFPEERTRRMLHASGCRSLVVDGQHQDRLAALLAGQPGDDRLTIILPPDVAPAAAFAPGCRCLEARAGAAPARPAAPSRAAYLLFTSGSTGQPKGVLVQHANVLAYLDYVAARYAPTPEDRFSQMFDMTFDLAMHDMFLCWGAGACLCVPRDQTLLAPARFIRDSRLTMWFSVPSAAIVMDRLGMLRPGAFPDLRLSLFCGEPLPGRIAAAWQQAAPAARLENLYGPTEATIAITHFTWQPGVSEARCDNGLVPIGQVFGSQACRVYGPDNTPAAPGQPGELLLGGSQVTAGYRNDPQKTASQFVRLPGEDGLWYRTGDLVRSDADGCLHYLSRLDQQVKIRGYRVELTEIEHTVREFSQAHYVVAVPHPVRQGLVEGLVLAVCGASCPAGDILAHCRQRLPDYMVPSRVLFLDEPPLNSNGKIDRAAVGRLVETHAT